ncbi:MAG: cation diffusion facilitator family transporter, partial [Verrucomicrobiales bacterium]|nr:cation diffusion facilitator family transporter [Verrucomicrobiales bacterium]
FVLWHAVARLQDPQEVRIPGMLLLAVLGILFNGAAVLRVRKGSSLTEKLVSWHLLEDTLGWVAVLVGAGIMAIWNAPIVDPLLSIGISLFVFWNVVKNLKKVFLVLLQTAPAGFDVEEFERQAIAIAGVQSVHHVHCWSIDGESHVFSAHIVIAPEVTDLAQVKSEVRALIDREKFEHITLETESEGESCALEKEKISD